MLVPLLLQYLETLSGLVDSNLNCGPVLTWMEVGPSGGLELRVSRGCLRSENHCKSVCGHRKGRSGVEEALHFSVCVGAGLRESECVCVSVGVGLWGARISRYID